MNILYLSCIFVSLLLLFYIINRDSEHSINVVLMCAILIISSAGFFASVSSTTLETAVLAAKISYLYGTFIPLLGFLTVCELCEIRISPKLAQFLYCIQFALYLIICTAGYNTLFIKSSEIFTYNKLSYLANIYGPAHLVYIITVCAYFVLSIAAAIYTYFKKKSISRSNTLLIISAYILGIIVFLVERMLNLKTEFTPVAGIIIYAGLMIPFYRVNFKKVQDIIIGSNETITASSYIAFDRKFRFLGCNLNAKMIFPEIIEYNAEKKVPVSENAIYRKILPEIKLFSKEEANSKILEISIGTMFYNFKACKIRNKYGRIMGYMAELSDNTERHKTVEVIESYSKKLESEVRGKTQRIREIQDKIILGMAQMIESRDTSTGGHIKRTSNVVSIFAKELLNADIGLSADFLHDVEKSAPMHDLGKIAVNDVILRKPGKYTPEEYEVMKTHSAEGAKVVREILTGVEQDDFISVAVNIAHYHHEKVDGTGYPCGLKGKEIPIEARIMALADVFDALVSKRCYKEAFTFDSAFEIIENSAGTHFDSQLAKIFIKCRPRLEALYRSYTD